MYILQIFLIFEISGLVNCECSITSWKTEFYSVGQSKCDDINYFIKGLRRDYFWPISGISNLDGIECCNASHLWSNTDVQVAYADWRYTLGHDVTWAHCPHGYFLQGLYRSDGDFLKNIEAARCAKPALHPFYYGSCYEQDISRSFVINGNGSCKEGHYITGLHRGRGGYLTNLDKLKCCTMAEKPQTFNKAEGIKERIMETTIVKMAYLADMLGYGYCYGKLGLNISEDFERNGTTWEASKKLFRPDKNCTKCEERLKLVYGNWSFAVKEINYGEIVVDELQPETIDTGTRFNRDRADTTETFEITKTVQETVTHSATDSWTNSHELGISLNFNLPFGLGSAGASVNFRYDISSSTTNERTIQNSRTFTIISSKTIKAHSFSKYNIIVYKTRSTIPYTAVIIAKFSTEFIGFMKHGGSYGSYDTNYHYQYIARSDRPNFNYSFGSYFVPFYEALKRESETQSKPWLWNEILRKNPTARQVIDSLTDETQYTFLLHGTLSRVAGTKVDVVWDSVVESNIARREAPDIELGKVPNSKEPKKAVAGPNDPPPKVVYPEVSVNNSNQAFIPIQELVHSSA